MSEILNAAKKYHNSKISVIPIRADGSKAPAVNSWKEYQSRLLTGAEARQWWPTKDPPNGGLGIAIICGEISGFLEVLDFDEIGIFDHWAKLVEAKAPGLVARLCRIRTPSGGDHLIYRCPDGIGGNSKLAMRGTKTRIETKGEGGYVIAWPSPAACHPEKRRWEVIAGDPTFPPAITSTERQILFESAASFDERDPVKDQTELTAEQRQKPTFDDRPGDEFNARGDWHQILETHGWTHVRRKGDRDEWRRPGKEGPGISATTGGDQDILWCFTTSTEFEPQKSYSKFAAWSILEHHGDFKAGARALRKMGYGAESKTEKQIKTEIQTETRTNKDTEYNPESLSRYSDLDNAKRFAKKYHRWLLYTKLGGGWRAWDGKRWAQNETHEEIASACRLTMERLVEAKRDLHNALGAGATEEELKILKHYVREAKICQSRSKIDSMIALARGDRKLVVRHSELDRDQWLLNLENGTLALQTGILGPHKQSDRITKLARAEYVPGAKCPRWDRFVGETFPDREVERFVQQLFGYALTGVIREHIMAIFWGSGSNGKSVLIGVLQRLLGDYAVSVDTEMIAPSSRNADPHPTGKADLLGRRLGIAQETESRCQLKAGNVKQLTGGDIVKARYMREDFFEFYPTHKLIMVTNHKPRIDDVDGGVWRRLALVPFENIVPDEAADTKLPEKLWFERSGILNWALEGCRQWREHGLDIPAVVRQATNDYKTGEDLLHEFFEDRLVIDSSSVTKFADIYKEYIEWSEDSGMRPSTKRTFGKMLDERGIYQGPRKSASRTRLGVRIRGTPKLELV